MPRTVLATERLILRGALPRDFEPLFLTVFSDAEVMQHLSWGAMNREQASEAFAEAFDFEGTGQRIGVLVERSTDAVVGYAGLKPCDALGDDDLELGFVLQRSLWGRGFASEIGRAQLEYGFRTTNRSRLLAQVKPGNAGSVNALRKLGMAFVKAYERPALGTWHVYCREREAHTLQEN